MAQKKNKANDGLVTLAIDIGGTGVKMMALNESGQPASERLRMPTPDPPTPKAVLQVLNELKSKIPAFDRVSVGFPGVVKHGKTLTAANLHKDWVGFALQQTLERKWGRPVRVANDSAVQGYAAIQGKGVEMVLTVGTGLGSAIYTDGHLCPGLELAHHPWRKKTYEDYLGRRGLEKYGIKRWNKLLERAIEQTLATFNWDTLYIGGGNSKKVTHNFTGGDVKLISNEDGLLGGAALWRDQQKLEQKS